MHPRWSLVAALVLMAAGSAGAQGAGVWLRVHPRAGDTLHTRLEQQTEMRGTVRGSGGPMEKSVTSSVTVASRTIVQASYPASTVVLTIVDSAEVHSSDDHAASQIAEAERSLRGQQLQLQLASDGSVESARNALGQGIPADLSNAMSAMPAVFPKYAVSVGEQWTRQMPLPGGGPMGAKSGAHVNAVFRLDSLDRAGNVAYISMRGEIKPDAEKQAVTLTGSVNGAMQVDQRRGWMTDSRVRVLIRSLITPPAGSGFSPMSFVTLVTQRLRTMDKR